MKRLYIDVSSLCRPFDDQDYARIRLETDAINLILTKIKENKYELIKSPVHYKEINSISDDFERIELSRLLDNYGKTIKVNSFKISERTEELISKKFGIADAAHISFAEFTGSIFITCDDKLLKKCKKYIPTLRCINPTTFSEMEDLR